MPRNITPQTTLENLRREAKRWLKAIREDVAEARARLERALPDATDAPTLRDVQHALAREHGVPGWSALRAVLSGQRAENTDGIRYYEEIAASLLDAYRTGDERSLETVWRHFGHRRTLDGMRRYVRVDLGKHEHDEVDITLDEARSLVARAHGFADWRALTDHVASLAAGTTKVARRPLRLFSVSATGDRETVATTRDWDAAIETIEDDEQITGLAAGEMTDALLERFSHIEHLTALDLTGSKGLSEAGFRHLARMPQLRSLNLGGTPTTDGVLQLLRDLPNLEHIELWGTPITDAGVSNLAACAKLRRVDLSGTRTGDGAIRALTGMPELADFRSGHLVTDAGLAALYDYPVFRTWRGGDVRMWLTGYDAEPNYLLLRGSFGAAGLATLAQLHGLFALNVDDERLGLPGSALAPLVNLPHLGWLAFDTKDDAMPYIAAMPSLRFLLCQDTTAGDDGFVALSRSGSIEYIWGRRCHNLRSRGFRALASMRSLRALSVSCLNVDDAGLSALPHFPALEELMPMDVPDDGYRHIGQCAKLESLVLMYCRETTDRATEHITGLPSLKKYFASYTRITDRTPELLSGIDSLENVSFSECHGLTNAGITALARLPRLRKLDLGGMPKITGDAFAAFPPRVRVHHSV
jgi:hypothetical protein